jgi:steroid delta-isomerase-like uncharacterized protein
MGDTKRFIERDLDAWNAHDKRAWTADIADDCDVKGPGGVSGTGRELRDMFYSMWTDGFPDNRIKPVVIAEDGENGVLEAVFEGTHTGTLNTPSGPIPATGRRASIRFVTTTKMSDGHFKSLHLYFDQVELMTQLGLMPAPTAAKA